jgi:glycosyltransferase involved in cell wall biosynthesis
MWQNGMPVYVIVSAYNRTEWLRVCLLSVLHQTYKDFKLVVVDDGSVIPLIEQPELTMIAADPRVVFLRKPNGGPASARNHGLDNVSDGYVLMLDSDDVLEPMAIEKLLDALLRSRAEFAAGAWANFTSTPDCRKVFFPKLQYQDPYANCVDLGGVLGSVMIKYYGDIHYNETRMPWEALEFFLDYLAPRRSAVYIEELIVNTRQHNNPERLTLKYDHFEPLSAGLFFAEKKLHLSESSLINVERAAALDSRILSCIHSLLRRRRLQEAKELFETVSWGLMDRYAWVRPGSFAWCSQRFGFLGAKSFIAVNRVIGRA